MLDGFPETGIQLIGRISEKLMARKMFLGTAESCTGGLAAAVCTGLPGSSRWFRGAVVAYDNAVKTCLLGVEPSIIARDGAVSASVVEAMAVGALAALQAQVTLAISGIAGPEGGSPDKVVGTVWIATALRLPEEENGAPLLRSFRRVFPGDRKAVRFGAVLGALGAVEEILGKR